MNRLLSKTADPYFVTSHIGAAGESFTYTATGKRATMTDASGTTTYSYDNRDRLTSAATPEGTLAYTYDAAGDVKTIQSSNANGASMAYGYDALDRLASVTDANGQTSYGYDAVGNLQSVTYPNGVAHAYTYDARNRLTNLGVAKGATGLASYAYTLDAAGHRTSVTEQSGRKVNYSYDTIYRLTNETIASDPNGMNGAVSYTYDNVGNRTQKTSTLPGFPGASSTYNANDELTTDQYDADGNTIGSGVNTGTSGYVYDFENRLVQQAGISIVYDGDGNRVSKATANGTTKYLVDDLNPTGYAQVLDEVQSSAVVRTYSWGLELISEALPAGSPLATGHSPLSYYVFDGHGSVRALTNAAGAITDTYDYDAFGILTHSTGTTPNNYLFAGEQFDQDLGLYYNRARYLNVSTGRFWTMDSLEGDLQEHVSLNAYSYASGGPTNNLDPTGHDDIADTLGAFTASDTLNNVTNIRPLSGFAKSRNARQLSNHGAAFIASWEDSSKILYDDLAGDCTIGIGHLVHMGACDGTEPPQFLHGLTDFEIIELFRNDLSKFQYAVIAGVHVPVSQGEFDSLVSLSFNIGAEAFHSSTLLKDLNQKLYFSASTHFLDWVKVTNPRTGKKEVSKGLTNRRSAERTMFDFEAYIHGDQPIQFSGYGIFF